MEPRDAFTLYQAYMAVQKRYAPGTIKEYSWVILLLCEFVEQEYPGADLDGINLAILDRFFASLVPKKLSSSTVCNFVVAIRDFFEWAVSRGYAHASPAVLLKRPRREDPFPRCLSDEVLAKVTAYIDGSDSSRVQRLDVRDRTLVALFLYSGLRRAEASQLNWGDIDLQGSRIIVRLGKGGQGRAVPLHPILREKLLLHRQFCNGGAAVFQHSDGTRLAPSGITDTFKNNVQPATDPIVTPHPLRHTFATHLLDSGVDLRVIQVLMGHKSIASTQRYVKVGVRHLQEAIRALEFNHSATIQIPTFDAPAIP